MILLGNLPEIRRLNFRVHTAFLASELEQFVFICQKYIEKAFPLHGDDQLAVIGDVVDAALLVHNSVFHKIIRGAAR